MSTPRMPSVEFRGTIEAAPSGAGNTTRSLTHSSDLSREGLAVDATHKTCTKCGETKPIDAFQRDRQKSDGRLPRCRDCKRVDTALYRAANRDKEIARGAAYREGNRERIASSAREYREANKERIRDATSTRRKKRPHVRWAISYRWRAKQFGFEPHIENFTLADVIAAYGDLCSYCGGSFDHLDHVIAVSKGGAHTLANVRPSCAPCNLHKYTADGSL